jgi:hypothetical protein
MRFASTLSITTVSETTKVSVTDSSMQVSMLGKPSADSNNGSGLVACCGTTIELRPDYSVLIVACFCSRADIRQVPRERRPRSASSLPFKVRQGNTFVPGRVFSPWGRIVTFDREARLPRRQLVLPRLLLWTLRAERHGRQTLFVD